MANKSKTGELLAVIQGNHVLDAGGASDGLRDYHAARNAVNANLLKGGPQAKLAHVKKVLKNYRVTVSLESDGVRVASRSGDTLIGGKMRNPGSTEWIPAKAIRVRRVKGQTVIDVKQ